MENKIVYSECRGCSRTTIHEIKFEEVITSTEGWLNDSNSWQVVQCRGCLTISFRHIAEDFDDLSENYEGVLVHSKEISLYPRVIDNHRELNLRFLLPDLIHKVYKQTVNALGEGSAVLASIGLRAIIEAVCNDLTLSGSNLDKRIEQLYKAGHVSNADKRRLHAIRFLGNDAAHEIKEPKPQELRVALDIVEHLLNTVYILDFKSRSLELTVETFKDFCELLQKCCGHYENNGAANLNALLGNRKRLLGGDVKLESFESELIQKIESKQITFLELANKQVVQNKEVQFYDIVKDETEIPF